MDPELEELINVVANEILEACHEKKKKTGNFAPDTSFNLEDIISKAVDEIMKACRIIKKEYPNTGTGNKVQQAGAPTFNSGNYSKPPAKMCCNAGRGRPWNYMSFSEPSKENCSWCKQVAAPPPKYYPRFIQRPPARPQARPQPRPQASPESCFQPQMQQTSAPCMSPGMQQMYQPKSPVIQMEQMDKTCAPQAFSTYEDESAGSPSCSSEEEGIAATPSCSSEDEDIAATPSCSSEDEFMAGTQNNSCMAEEPMQVEQEAPMPYIPQPYKSEYECTNRFNEGLMQLMHDERQNQVCEEKETTVYEPFQMKRCKDMIHEDMQERQMADNFNQGLMDLMQQEKQNTCSEDQNTSGPQKRFELISYKDKLKEEMQERPMMDRFNQGLIDLMLNENQDDTCDEQETPPQLPLYEPKPRERFSCNDAVRMQNQAQEQRDLFNEGLKRLIEEEAPKKPCMPQETVPASPEPEKRYKPTVCSPREAAYLRKEVDRIRPTMYDKADKFPKEPPKPCPIAQRAREQAREDRFNREMDFKLDLINHGMDKLMKNRFPNPPPPPRRPGRRPPPPIRDLSPPRKRKIFLNRSRTTETCPPREADSCPPREADVCPPSEADICPPNEANVCPPSEADICSSSETESFSPLSSTKFSWPEVDPNIENLEDISISLVGTSAESSDEDDACN